MNVAQLLSERAVQSPDAAAVIAARPTAAPPVLTFSALEAAAARAATLLQQQGLQAGDAVLVFVPLSANLYVALAALFRLGLVAMFVDPSAGRERLEQCCRIHPPKALIASVRAQLLRVVSPALRRIPIKFVVGGNLPGAIPWSRAARLPAGTILAACDADSPALLTFTSGTTGEPKAAVRTHGFLRAQYRILANSLELRAGEVDLTTQAIFTLANLAAGVTSLLPDADLRRPDRIRPGAVIAQIRRHRPHRCSASPAFLERIVEHAEAGGFLLDSFTKILVGGGPVYPGLLERTQAVAPQAEVIAVYGSTEAEPIAHVAWQEVAPTDLEVTRSGGGLLAGRAIADIEVRILRDSWGAAIPRLSEATFRDRCLPVGEAGEIVVHGPHVLRGYLHGRGDRDNKFEVDGVRWHRTGDAGYVDERGRLWLLGRCSARIDDEHGSVYPFAIEYAAHHHPAIHRAAAVLHRSQRSLVLEIRDGHRFDSEVLLSSLSWAKLARLQVVDRMPVDKRHNAKIDYPAVHQLLERRTVG